MLWSWLGVGVALASGVFLAPYLIGKLGDEGYGIWVLVFGLVESYSIFDFGLRSAMVKYSAHYRATAEPERINEVLNTGIAFFSAVATVVFLASVYLSRHIDRLFQVSPANRGGLAFLVLAVGASWSTGMVFNVFSACLEGFQRFDAASRIAISVTMLRVGGSFVLLATGYRLIGLGVYVVSCQVFGYLLSWAALSRAFPLRRLGPRFATWPMFRQLAGYGVHTLAGAAGYQLLYQGAPLMIGHFHPAAFVGYYNVPLRLLQYPAAAVDRVGGVASSTAAELTARREGDAIARLGIYANRYCLTLFLPAAVFLAIYGPELVNVWIRKPEYAAHSAALFVPLLIGWTLGIAAQFNSGSILYGIAQHRWFARGLLAEGLLLTGALWYVVPRYGLAGAAWAGSLLMLADRGLFTPWLLCRYVQIGYFRYMLSIYARPMAAAVPATVFAFWLKARVLTGANLGEVLAAAVLVAAVYCGIAFFACVEPQHRSLVGGLVRRRMDRAQSAKMNVRRH